MQASRGDGCRPILQSILVHGGIPMTAYATHRRRSRQASVLIAVLVCLAVAMALVTSSVRSSLIERRAIRTQHQLRQTELLLAAGIQRATRQLEADADYTGETWVLAPEVLPTVESAQVKIDVTSASEDLAREVHVTARLATGPHTAIQRSYLLSLAP